MYDPCYFYVYIATYYSKKKNIMKSRYTCLCTEKYLFIPFANKKKKKKFKFSNDINYIHYL